MPNSTAYSDTAGLAPLTTYTYRVTATNAVGASPPSNTATATTLSLVVLAAPTNLTAVMLSANKVQLAWVDNSTGETGYVVERQINAGAWTIMPPTLAPNATGTTLTFTLNAGNFYRFRVRAVNGATNGPNSNVALVNLTVSPAPPSGFTATSTVPGRVDLAWTDNSNNNSSFTLQTRVRFFGLFWGAWTNVSTTIGANATSYAQTGLPAGQVRQYRIRAVNVQAPSVWVNSPSVTVQ